MSCCGHHLAQQLQPLCANLGIEKIDACQVAARPGEAGDKADCDRVSRNGEDNRGRRGRRLGRKRATRDRDDRGDLSASQIGRQRWKPIDLIVGPAVFDRYVLALDMTGFLQTLAKSAQTVHVRAGRRAVQEPDHRHRLLLRPRRQRPCRRACKSRDELAPSHVGALNPALGQLATTVVWCLDLQHRVAGVARGSPDYRKLTRSLRQRVAEETKARPTRVP